MGMKGKGKKQLRIWQQYHFGDAQIFNTCFGNTGKGEI